MKKKGSNSKSKSTKKPARFRAGFLFFVLFTLLMSFAFLGGFSRFGCAMADNAINSGTLEKADGWLDFVDRYCSKTGEYYFERARLARMRGDLDKMADFLKKSLELGFDRVALERQQVVALLSIGTPDSSIEDRVKGWIREAPGDISDLVNSYANGLVTQSRYEEALKLLELYKADFPKDPMPYYRMGRIHEHYESRPVAEEEYRSALKIDPGFAPAAFALARSESKKNRFKESLEIYQKFDQGKTQLAAKLGAAKSLRMMGELEESEKMMEIVYAAGFEACNRSFHAVDETAAGRFIVAAELGKLELELGDFQSALEHVESALQKCPNDYSARMTYVQILKRLGRKEEAEIHSEKNRHEQEVYESVTEMKSRVKRDEKDVEARFEVGRLLFENESEDAGLFWIKGVLMYDSNHEKSLNFLFNYYDKRAKESDTVENSSMQKLAKLYKDRLDAIKK